jgi:ATP-dependent 26S proteasome regulatory subunit
MSTTDARIRWTEAAFKRLLAQARAEGWGPPGGEIQVAEVNVDGAGTLELLNHRLGLSELDTDALWLLACCEIDPVLGLMVNSLRTTDVPDLTVSSWFRLVECATGHVARTSMVEVLHRLGLIETTWDPQLPLHRRPVRASDQIVEMARTGPTLDREVSEIATIFHPNEVAARAHDIPPSLHQAYDEGAIVMAVGVEGSGRATLLGHLAGWRGRATLRVNANCLPSDDARLSRRCRAIARDARLFDFAIMLEDADVLADAARRTVCRDLLDSSPGAVLVTARDEIRWTTGRALVIQRTTVPSKTLRAVLWREGLGHGPAEVIEHAAASYSLMPGTILAAAKSARACASSPTVESVREGLQAHLDHQLRSVATRVACTQTWSDLVLPSDQLEQVVELVARVRHRHTVLNQWGFARKVGRGLGVSTLLSGPPGTGKTMIAGLVAKELGLDLYMVDLSKVVSKYIGETEKNLAMVFDAAESGHAIILFDEADSLFAKRTAVSSSNDRYANLEVNFLLQRIEQFGGVSILTTNHESAIDPAFRRRIAVHVRFPMPDEAQREELWRAVLPEAAPVEDTLDFEELAREFEMTGGHIKNAVIRAAYLAANEHRAISAAHLRRGARAEIEAMGKVVRG